MQCHGEKGMFYLGVLMEVRRSKSCTDATSAITCGHHTILHAWTISIRGKMPRQKDTQSPAEEYYRLVKI